MIYVSPTGNDRNSGKSLRNALKTPNAAVAAASPGTAVCFDAGTYPPMKIAGKKGTADKPIIFQTVPGKERQATFTFGKLAGGIGIAVELSTYVEIRNLRVANSLKGIAFDSVSHCVMQGNLVENLGQEALRVGRLHTFDSSKRFLGPDSEYVQVVGNRVEGTGKVKAEYGEGIYIGTGAFRGDHTHDVRVEGNVVNDIGAEGIELKPGTYNLIVRGNAFSNTHHEYNGAITVCVEGSETEDGNYLIEDNLVWNIKKVKYGVSGIAIGNGNAVIRNNVIWAVEGGIGIRVYETFANPKALLVVIANNTIFCDGPNARILRNGTAGGKASPLKALLQVKNTYTNDGSAGSTRTAANLFAGPLTGDADAGRGPGSGFEIKNYRGTGADYAKIRKWLPLLDKPGAARKADN